MSGVSALIEIYKMTEVSVETRIRLLHVVGEIVNWELGTNATEPLVKELVDLLNSDTNVCITELNARIAELEAMVERLIELGDVINGDKDSVWTLQTIKECWTEDVTKWKERE